MNERWINPQVKKVFMPMAIAVLCTAMSFGFSYLFPQAERWLADWKLSNRPSPPIAQSIVMIHAEEKSFAFCGEGRWNLNVLKATFSALHQAGASVIAPMLDISLPVASECGGLAGFVQLAEVTKHVGLVVYPESVPAALTQAAFRTGSLELPSDEEGRVGGFTFNSSSLSSPRLPFGIAVASSIKGHITFPTTNSFLHVPRTLAEIEGGIFPRHQFSDVWRLVQAGKRKELARLFQGQVVFLYSDFPMSMSVTPTKIFGYPNALLHAKFANEYLTNAWAVPTPFFLAFLIAISLSCLVVVPISGEFPRSNLGFISGIITLIVSMCFFLGFGWGWLWPFFTMGLAVGLMIVGMGTWKLWQSQATVHQQIVRREEKLTQLEHELLGKQHHARQLEEQLSQVQSQSNESETVIGELQIAQNTALSQLERYQDEIEETRRKIDGMQEELHDLRQHTPVFPAEIPSEPTDRQELIQECEVFQIVTRDQSVLRLFQNLKKAAATQVPILLLGETGTGKEIFAKAAHALSPRRQDPFVSVNIAAIRAELFEGELFGHVKGAFTGAVGRTGFLESAHGGTLFLDEVGDLPLDLQAKLLRFLEDGGFHRVGQSAATYVDVRIVAATNRDLQDEVLGGRYREDLYYRLRGMVLTLPPLRERSRADHVLLAQSFLQQCASAQHRTGLAFTQGALDTIMAHQWPGNIRELRHTIGQAVALATGPMITDEDLNLREPITSPVRENWVKEDLGQREDAMVLECLRRHKFEMQATAATLGWDRGTVTQRLKGLGFQALMKYEGNIQAAAQALAGEEKFVRVVEVRLREYANNLIPSSKHYGSVEEAIADCRKRFRNLPERHFPAVEQLIHAQFGAS